MDRKALIFDLDGTLVDTALDLHRTLNVVLDELGRPPVPDDQVRALIGDGARKLVERGLEITGGLPEDAAFEQAVERFFAYYGDHLADYSRPFPNVETVLDQMAEAGHVLGVCTNKAETFSVSLLDQLGLLNRFAAVVGGDTLPFKKPDGRHLQETVAAMGAVGRPAVMIGDSRNDVASARNAGFPVVVVSFGYRNGPVEDLGADYVIDDFIELPNLLADLA